MKLRNKVLLGVGVIWIGFLILAFTASKFFLVRSFLQLDQIQSNPKFQVAIQNYTQSFIILGLASLLLLLWLLRILFLNRLEKLNHQINIHTDSTYDELSSVARQIEERANELKTTNQQLKQEIAERAQIENELNIHKAHLVRLAHYDDLTSLPNRVFFHEMLNKTIHHANRHKKLMAILFIDIDRFKNINDEFGTAAGDLVLKEIANRFATVLRSGDTLARLGGDEFIILLNDIGHAKFASPVADKLLQACSEPIKIDHHEVMVTISIGICLYPNDGESLENIQKNADYAMYRAKESGGGVYQYFTKEMNSEAHRHIQLEAALRKAINNNEFVLYYQPKLNLSDGTMAGVEALIRWENPEFGIISPTEFIPLAEETGLIMQIGEWALREACRANKAWQQQGFEPVAVAVNLSPKQFQHQDVAQLVESVLQEIGLDAKYLELEITETAIMSDVSSTVSKLQRIKKMGVHISVDDFGTGYTSISYLKKFPISLLKIDQSFVKGITYNQNDSAITSAVIALAHSLGMKVIAEGVENAEQLQYLADKDCDIVQGYYLSRPLPEQKIILQFSKVEKESLIKM
jgi:diguanylate cyclase (GGDEF)-like protein